jgi:hypothetical protein
MAKAGLEAQQPILRESDDAIIARSDLDAIQNK